MNDYNNGGYEQNFYQQPYQPIDINNLRTIKNGAIWYVAVLPLLAAFLESFAISIYLGIILWSFVLIADRVICSKDEKKLAELGLSRQGMSSLAKALPLVYIFQRNMLLRKSNMCGIMFAIFSAYAFFSNGFMVSYTADADDFISYAQNSGIFAIDQLSDSTATNSILDRTEYFLKDDEWLFADYDDTHSVTVNGTFRGDTSTGYENCNVRITFEFNFDGYNFKTMDMTATECEINGVILNQEDTDTFISQLYSTLEQPQTKADDSDVPSSDKGQATISGEYTTV